LKKIQIEKLQNNQSFKEIEKMLLNKRKSLCFAFESNYDDKSYKLNRIFQKIDSSFMDCGKIGVVLCELFCDLIGKQLNAS